MKRRWGQPDNPLLDANIAFLLIMLSGLCLFLFFFRLADMGIMYPSWEPRRMLLAKDMVTNGHWLVPDLLGKPYVAKPPILPWLISIGYLLIGSPSLWATRVLPALAGLLNVFVTFFFGKKLFNQRVGFLAAVILATSLLYIQRTRMAEEDIILTLFINLALFTFFLAYHYSDKRYYLLFYLFVSLACLTKGVPGLIFPVLTIIPYLFFRRDLRALGKMTLLPGALIFTVLVVSWYIYAFYQGGASAAGNLIMTDIWHKFFPQEHNSRPFYQYVVQLFAHFFPWSVFLPALTMYIVAKKRKEEKDHALFLFSWIITNLLLFSLIGAKRNEYILPLYPALAIVVAQVWDKFLVDKKDSLLKKLTLLGIFIFAFLAIGGGLFGPIFSLMKYPEDILWNSLLGLLFVLGGLAILFFAKRRQYIVFFPVVIILMMGFIFTFTVHIAPTYLRYTTPNEFCAKVASTIGRDAALISFKCQDEFIINELDRMITDIDQESDLDRYLARGKQIFIIMDGKDFLRLKDEKPLMHLLIFQDHFLKMKRSVALVTNTSQN